MPARSSPSVCGPRSSNSPHRTDNSGGRNCIARPGHGGYRKCARRPYPRKRKPAAAQAFDRLIAVRFPVSITGSRLFFGSTRSPIFHGCRYDKGSRTCAEPDHIEACPVPSHDLRNGRLNQTAYSLYLFFRDIADGDLVGWIDQQLREGAWPHDADRLARLRACLIEPLRQVYGVSDKVLTMTLSCILLAAPRGYETWVEVGASMIAIDTLVHNFLHRTGILHRFGAGHAYGAACYRPNGCADIIAAIAQRIDAGAFNPRFPAVFPRLRAARHLALLRPAGAGCL